MVARIPLHSDSPGFVLTEWQTVDALQQRSAVGLPAPPRCSAEHRPDSCAAAHVPNVVRRLPLGATEMLNEAPRPPIIAEELGDGARRTYELASLRVPCERSAQRAQPAPQPAAAIPCGPTADMTPFAAPFLLRADGVIKPLSIAGGLPGAYAPGEPNAVYRRCTRFGAAPPIPWPLARMRRARCSGTRP